MVADDDSLRYYPAFDVPARTILQPQHRVAKQWGPSCWSYSGSTVGDTHTYDEPFPFDLDETPMHHLLLVAGDVLAEPLPAVARRWAGVYSQVTDPALLYLRAEVAAAVQVVTGPGGRGMTLAPAIAEETFT